MFREPNRIAKEPRAGNSGRAMLRAMGLLLALLLAGCATARTQRNFSAQNPRGYRITVLPLESSNPFIPGSVLSDYITTHIIQNLQEFHVIERKDLMKIIQEQKLSVSGMVKQEKISPIGSILGVDSILVGSVQTVETIQSVGGTISITLKLMDVSTGRVLWADHQKVSVATWSVKEVPEIADELMEKSAHKMVGRLEKHFKEENFSSLSREIKPDEPKIEKLASYNPL